MNESLRVTALNLNRNIYTNYTAKCKMQYKVVCSCTGKKIHHLNMADLLSMNNSIVSYTPTPLMPAESLIQIKSNFITNV